VNRVCGELYEQREQISSAEAHYDEAIALAGAVEPVSRPAPAVVKQRFPEEVPVEISRHRGSRRGAGKFRESFLSSQQNTLLYARLKRPDVGCNGFCGAGALAKKYRAASFPDAFTNAVLFLLRPLLPMIVAMFFAITARPLPLGSGGRSRRRGA